MKDAQAVKKRFISALIVGVFVAYSFIHGRSSAAAPASPASTSATNPRAAAPTATGAPGSPSTASSGTPGATSTPSGRYKNGTYTGSVADAQWGYVQVQAVIQNGAIANVQFLQYPNERDRSVQINQYADPQLISEAIQAQSAQVDLVTGATDTSYAFIQSLSDALSQAQA
ncbi:MAG: FMN-binding protein [Ktedonobacterales bacterium]